MLHTAQARQVPGRWRRTPQTALSLCMLQAAAVSTMAMADTATIAGAESAVLAPTAQAVSQGPQAMPPQQPAQERADAPAEAKAAAAVTGKIAWYGRQFAGRKTASGERFDPALMTMAHRSWPLGTQVRVTNLRNQRSVVVTVNDRGPYTPGRIADLSEGAARLIGLLHIGVTEARLERLDRLDRVDRGEPRRKDEGNPSASRAAEPS